MIEGSLTCRTQGMSISCLQRPEDLILLMQQTKQIQPCRDQPSRGDWRTCTRLPFADALSEIYRPAAFEPTKDTALISGWSSIPFTTSRVPCTTFSTPLHTDTRRSLQEHAVNHHMITTANTITSVPSMHSSEQAGRMPAPDGADSYKSTLTQRICGYLRGDWTIHIQ